MKPGRPTTTTNGIRQQRPAPGVLVHDWPGDPGAGININISTIGTRDEGPLGANVAATLRRKDAEALLRALATALDCSVEKRAKVPA